LPNAQVSDTQYLIVPRGGIEPPKRGFSIRGRGFWGLNIQPIAALASPLPSHTKARSWHIQSELVAFLASWHEPLVGPPHRRIVRTLYGYYNQPGCRETVFMKHSSTKRREDRLEVRLTPKAKSMLRRAASV